MSVQAKASSRNAESSDETSGNVTYAKGFDDPNANVILMGSDNIALRVHDYFLKAAR
jgi:hypothetical protein